MQTHQESQDTQAHARLRTRKDLRWVVEIFTTLAMQETPPLFLMFP